MTIAEFVEKWAKQGESVASIADQVTRAKIADDGELVAAANAMVDAENKFYEMMLERGLEQ